MIFQAHRGVSTENPENTMPAFIAAVRQGYEIIELDVSVTKDLKFVLLHDDTINRTGRDKNGDLIPEPVNIFDITYEEALKYDVGIWFSKKFKGTKIPLLEDVLKLVSGTDIKLKIDNKFRRFTPEQKEAFFEFLKPYEDIACLTCYTVEELKSAYKIFPKMHFHYDGLISTEILEELRAILPREQLTVWLPIKCKTTSWVKVAFVDEELSKTVKQYARLGLWLLANGVHLEEAERFGADVVETSGQLKPPMNVGLIADMHTHSESSHDSVCKIEDMAVSQIDKGTDIFAVTDHFDTESYNRYDVFTPIEIAEKTVKELNKKFGDKQLILSGIEISEGFWYPEIYKKAMGLVDYDVVIGSVHLVKYKDLTYAYSGIDFSKLKEETIIEYLDAYFDDVLTMIETTDFDILAHLTCPLRYIRGKYNVNIDMSRYEEKIEKILCLIIKKGIALEVNTASFDTLNTASPSVDILKKYYDMDGYLLTLGSDAHVAPNASKHFDKAIKEIKELGFENIFYYKQRKQIQITI